MGKIEERLLDKIRCDGAIHMTLIDPEEENIKSASKKAAEAERGGTSAIMIGGSTAMSASHLDDITLAVKKTVSIPIILFPSNVAGISRFADAIWFMSLLNSTNPYFITTAQALGAPMVKKYGLEPLPMGYIIIGEGGVAGLVGQAHLIPYHMPKIAVAYALAAQYLGMHFVYLEAGSGAKKPIPQEMVKLVRETTSLPLIVGGGITNENAAKQIVKAGADIIVTGTLVEKVSFVEEKISAIIEGIKSVAKPKSSN
jgi:phosphoglycerol geranylgeranyltransferase